MVSALCFGARFSGFELGLIPDARNVPTLSASLAVLMKLKLLPLLLVPRGSCGAMIPRPQPHFQCSFSTPLTSPQFEDRETLDALLDNLFTSFDCDGSGA